MTPRIAIRTRASLGYGWGHLMRARRLRDYFQHAHPEVKIALAVEGDAAVHATREAWGDEWTELDDGTSVADEASWLEALAPDVVVADLLEVETDRLACWRAKAQVVVFDDLTSQRVDADLVIRPQQLGTSTSTQNSLAGADYFIVDPTLCEGETGARRRVENLLVVMGGCLPDPVANWTRELVAELLQAPFQTTLLTGFDGAAELEDLVSSADSPISLVAGSQDVARHMRAADLAVAASGYAKYELAAAGTPALLVAIVEHQEQLGADFAAQSGAARYLGAIREVTAKDVMASVTELLVARETRQAMAEAGRKLVDGRGAERVAQAILKTFSQRSSS